MSTLPPTFPGQIPGNHPVTLTALYQPGSSSRPLLRRLRAVRGVRGLLGGVPAHVPPRRGRPGPHGLRGALRHRGTGLPQARRRRLQVLLSVIIQDGPTGFDPGRILYGHAEMKSFDRNSESIWFPS